MFDNFPKKRPPLPEEIKNIYKAHYKLNRKGETKVTSLSKKMESWMHKQIAKDVVKNQDIQKSTLEIGAGTLNQLQYEPMVEIYDIIEPFQDLFKNSPYLKRIRNVYKDISDIPADSRYDRITSVATLEHICNLPLVVAKSAILLKKEDGTFCVSIPSEGTFFWTLGWKLTTGIEFKLKYGLDYGILMKHEHVNTAKEIEEVLEYFFRNITCKVFGISKEISLYRYYQCKNPIVDRCYKFIKWDCR